MFLNLFKGTLGSGVRGLGFRVLGVKGCGLGSRGLKGEGLGSRASGLAWQAQGSQNPEPKPSKPRKETTMEPMGSILSIVVMIIVI